MMTPAPQDITDVARRVAWFKPAAETLADTRLFLAHLMTYGADEDIIIARRHYTTADFIAVLRDAPPGVFDPRSWAYWHLVFDLQPTPPLPQRLIFTDAEKKDLIPFYKSA